jgi:hypothetical protein
MRENVGNKLLKIVWTCERMRENVGNEMLKIMFGPVRE